MLPADGVKVWGWIHEMWIPCAERMSACGWEMKRARSQMPGGVTAFFLEVLGSHRKLVSRTVWWTGILGEGGWRGDRAQEHGTVRVRSLPKEE